MAGLKSGRKAITPEMRAYIKYMKNTSATKLAKETGVSRSQIYRLWKEPIGLKPKPRKPVSGRPKKLTKRDERRLIRLAQKLSVEYPKWKAKTLRDEAGMQNVSLRTIYRILNKNGYYYLPAREEEDFRGIIWE